MTTAIKFIQDHGIDRARGVVNGAPAICAYFEDYPLGVRYYRSDIGCNRAINLSDLKPLVESVDKVIKLGGINEAKAELNRKSILRWITPEIQSLKKAIADYEEIYPK